MGTETGLFKKLASIRATVGKVEKDGTNKHQSYKYQSIDAINTAIRSAMNEAGVWFFSECPKIEPVDGQWVCDYRFTFVDMETGQSQTLNWSQAAPMNDKNDKLVGIIHSYAQKYFLIRTFLITTDEDMKLDLDSGENNKDIGKVWNKYEMTTFWNEWCKAKGIKDTEIFKVLGISKLSDWKHSLAAANERMELAQAG